ncbi:MAG: Y-family DNA polymerase [Tannerellaceae bacterium]
MFGLVDCNNFFASCERVFNPALRGRPMVVLSSNDGCVIARSNEAKALDIPMGAPVFQVKEIIEKNEVAVFSGNMVLYGDMSHRVMSTLAAFVEEMEIYSIDEAFLNLDGFAPTELVAYGQRIVRTTTKNTGIPVSLGIAPTKTLAKIASLYAKKYPAYEGVCIIDTEEKREKALRLLEIEKVWGIGRRSAKTLRYYGIQTAYDLTQRSESWIRRQMNAPGVHTWKELRGIPCYDIEAETDKQTICTSRSFGEMIDDYQTLSETVGDFTASCASKLRKQKCCAGAIIVFIYTNRFRADLPQYNQSHVEELPVATNDPSELIHYAGLALQSIFRKGYQYKKAGVIVANIIPETCVQGHLFDNKDRVRQRKLMSALDTINKKYGNHSLKVVAQGSGKSCKLKNEFVSRRFTTNLDDIITIS